MSSEHLCIPDKGSYVTPGEHNEYDDMALHDWLLDRGEHPDPCEDCERWERENPGWDDDDS